MTEVATPMTLPGVEAPHPTPDTVDRTLVATVVPYVELEDVYLDWCHVEVNCHRSNIPTDWASRAEVFVDTHLHREAADRFRAYAFIQLRWDEQPTVDDDEPDLGVSAIYALDYSLAVGVTFDDTALEHFCVFNGTFNAWPYWREFVQTTTQRLGVTPFVMPVMRVTSKSLETLRTEQAAQERPASASRK